MSDRDEHLGAGLADQSSPFPPPTASDAHQSAPPTPAPTQQPKSKRGVVVVAVVGAAVLLAIGGWIALRDRGGQASTAGALGLDRLPTDPQERYQITFDESVKLFFETTGSPRRMAGRAVTQDGDELRVFDDQGTEMWRRNISSDARFEMLGDDVILGDPSDDGRDAKLLRLKGDSGDELWSTDVSDITSLTITPDSITLVDYGSSNLLLEAYDPASGNKTGEYPMARSAFEGPILSAPDAHIVTDDGELFAVNERLEKISPPISWEEMGKPSAWAYMNGEVLAVNGRRLTLFAADGTQRDAADFDVDGIEQLYGVDDSAWMYQSAAVCGVLRLADGKAESLWERTDDCVVNGLRVVQYPNADPLLMSSGYPMPVTNAFTGEPVVASSEGNAVAYSNGFVELGGDELTAYAWPGGQQLFSIPREAKNPAWMIDDGYVTADATGDQFEITVFG